MRDPWATLIINKTHPKQRQLLKLHTGILKNMYL